MHSEPTCGGEHTRSVRGTQVPGPATRPPYLWPLIGYTDAVPAIAILSIIGLRIAFHTDKVTSGSRF